MSKSITQDMAYRQSLMKYAEKYGVSRASRKYNKSRSYIYFWKARWDGTVQSLACQSRRPHSHPNQHTETELKLIRDMRRRNPDPVSYTHLYTMVPLLMSTATIADELAAASLSRGLDADTKRTSIEDVRLRPQDYLLIVFSIVIAVTGGML